MSEDNKPENKQAEALETEKEVKKVQFAAPRAGKEALNKMANTVASAANVVSAEAKEHLTVQNIKDASLPKEQLLSPMGIAMLVGFGLGSFYFPSIAVTAVAVFLGIVYAKSKMSSNNQKKK